MAESSGDIDPLPAVTAESVMPVVLDKHARGGSANAAVVVKNKVEPMDRSEVQVGEN